MGSDIPDTRGTRLSEAELRAVLRDWTADLPTVPGRVGDVHRRVRQHRTRVAASSVAVCTALVLVVAGVAAMGSHRTKAVVPAVKKPTIATPMFPSVFQGGTVRGQATGVGATQRTITLIWPAYDTTRVVYRCTGVGETGVIGIEVPGYDSVATGCLGAQVGIIDLTSSLLVAIPSGTPVRMTVSTSGSVTGRWGVAVLDLDRHWLDAGLPAPKYDGLKLLTSFRGGARGEGSETFTVTKGESTVTLVEECSEAGTLGVTINGHFLTSTQCPDQPWSLHRVAIPPSFLTQLGWAVGARVTLSLTWSGSDDPPAGILVYAK
jgi:hypothetical protein